MQNPVATVAFTPNGLRYLVFPDPVEAKSETIGDITISQQADVHQKASEGTIVSVGDATEERVMVDGSQRIYTRFPKYSVGDKVIYGKYAGYEHSFDGVEYKVLAEAEILGIRVPVPFDEMTAVQPICSACERPTDGAMYCHACLISHGESQKY